MVPHVSTVAETRAVVESCYPPQGHRSASGSGPALGYASRPQGEINSHINEQTLLIAMLETPEAIDNADAIAAVEGIDMLHIGSSDLSTEMGIPGQYKHARARRPVARQIDGRRRRSRGLRISDVANSARDALSNRRLGCRLHP
jgi:2-keto-3-deoxy-L-rhamnonate aldolase RhmA